MSLNKEEYMKPGQLYKIRRNTTTLATMSKFALYYPSSDEVELTLFNSKGFISHGLFEISKSVFILIDPITKISCKTGHAYHGTTFLCTDGRLVLLEGFELNMLELIEV